jgi:hypothetical protein
VNIFTNTNKYKNVFKSVAGICSCESLVILYPLNGGLCFPAKQAVKIATTNNAVYFNNTCIGILKLHSHTEW